MALASCNRSIQCVSTCSPCLLLRRDRHPAAAQERPFLFSVATAPAASRRSDSTTTSASVSGRFRAILPISPSSASVSRRRADGLTLLARVGIAEVGSSYQSSQSGELLYTLPGRGEPRGARGRRRGAPRSRRRERAARPRDRRPQHGGLAAARQPAVSEAAVVRSRRGRPDHEHRRGPQVSRGVSLGSKRSAKISRASGSQRSRRRSTAARWAEPHIRAGGAALAIDRDRGATLPSIRHRTDSAARSAIFRRKRSARATRSKHRSRFPSSRLVEAGSCHGSGYQRSPSKSA